MMVYKYRPTKMESLQDLNDEMMSFAMPTKRTVGNFGTVLDSKAVLF